ncbi:MAG: response regulator transcription factor, partial [Actinomycetota bacterium]|nr:response regulator transcription factor [Actinomycetota bacterium]
RRVPVVMLTARDDETDLVVGLSVGADDYVTKPFSPRELAARVRSVLRRSAPTETAIAQLAFGDVELEQATREARKAHREIRLTAKEFDLLWFLASHPRRVFSREQLMAKVWGYTAALDTGTVTVHVRRLREKIEDQPSSPRHLETVWGVGYRLVPRSRPLSSSRSPRFRSGSCSRIRFACCRPSACSSSGLPFSPSCFRSAPCSSPGGSCSTWATTSRSSPSPLPRR